jgi:hypothetical protein
VVLCGKPLRCQLQPRCSISRLGSEHRHAVTLACSPSVIGVAHARILDKPIAKAARSSQLAQRSSRRCGVPDRVPLSFLIAANPQDPVSKNASKAPEAGADQIAACRSHRGSQAFSYQMQPLTYVPGKARDRQSATTPTPAADLGLARRRSARGVLGARGVARVGVIDR